MTSISPTYGLLTSGTNCIAHLGVRESGELKDSRYPQNGDNWEDENRPSCDDGNIQQVVVELRKLTKVVLVSTEHASSPVTHPIQRPSRLRLRPGHDPRLHNTYLILGHVSLRESQM